jgi:hypothetical protein
MIAPAFCFLGADWLILRRRFDHHNHHNRHDFPALLQGGA